MAITALHRFGTDDLNPNETIIYRAHLNFISFIVSSKFFILSLALGIAILAVSFVYRTTIGFLIDETITIGVIMVAGIFLGWGGYKFFHRSIDWWYDEDIITDQRVIDYNQKFLFSKDLTTASMRSIENIILIQDGLLQTLFNYGVLDVQTSATGGHGGVGGKGNYLIMNDISRPKQVQQLIDEIAYRAKREIDIDPDEVLIKSGLKKGDLTEYFVVKKTKGWRKRVMKLMGW